MSNTSCKQCAFASTVSSETPCDFHIIEKIQEYKKIETRDDYNYIYDYQCRFGFSKEMAQDPRILQEIPDLKAHLKQKSEISYSLWVDISDPNTQIPELCEEINLLDIKPRHVSFISSLSNDPSTPAKTIEQHLQQGLLFKVHNFIEEIPLEKSLKAALTGNMRPNNSALLMVYRPNNKSKVAGSLNDRVNFVNKVSQIQQRMIHIFCMDMDELDGLCLSFQLYQAPLDVKYTSFLEAIQNRSGVSILKYDSETN